MTLNTRIFVQGEVDIDDLFAHCQKLLSTFDELKRPAEAQKSSREPSSYEDGKWILSNHPMQNLPAWLMIYYRPEEEYRSKAEAEAHSSYCNLPENEYYEEDIPDCDGSDHRPHCHVEVSFDTAYGYRSPTGKGCGDLHAVLVTGVGEWLDARGIPWRWLDECAGEVRDGYQSLVHLVHNGDSANSWFRKSVAPALAIMGAVID